MKRMALFVVTSLIVVLGTAMMVTADVPQMMNYQGKLTGPDGDYQMIFRIYDAGVAGNIIWEETHTVVTVTDGYFSVLLGSITPITDDVFNGTDRWLGITIGTDPELAPRTRLVTAPYAFRSSTIDGASGGTVTGNVVFDGSIYTAGGSGDANMSGGQPDITDVTLITDYLNKNTFLTEEGYAEADVDGDGKVTSDDLAILTQMMFYLETKEQAWRTIHSSYGARSESGDIVFFIRGKTGIGTGSPAGALDITSTTGGLVVPRMTTAERDALTPVNGTIIYNTTDNQFNFYENGAWVTK